MGIRVEETPKGKKRRQKIVDEYESTQELSALKYPKDEILRRIYNEKDPDIRQAMSLALTTPGATKEANKRRRRESIWGEQHKHRKFMDLRKYGGKNKSTKNEIEALRRAERDAYKKERNEFVENNERKWYEEHRPSTLELNETGWTSPYNMPVYQDQHGKYHSESSATYPANKEKTKWITTPSIFPDPFTGEARYWEEEELRDYIISNDLRNPVNDEKFQQFDTKQEAIDLALERNRKLNSQVYPWNREMGSP